MKIQIYFIASLALILAVSVEVVESANPCFKNDELQKLGTLVFSLDPIQPEIFPEEPITVENMHAYTISMVIGSGDEKKTFRLNPGAQTLYLDRRAIATLIEPESIAKILNTFAEIQKESPLNLQNYQLFVIHPILGTQRAVFEGSSEKGDRIDSGWIDKGRVVEIENKKPKRANAFKDYSIKPLRPYVEITVGDQWSGQKWVIKRGADLLQVQAYGGGTAHCGEYVHGCDINKMLGNRKPGSVWIKKDIKSKPQRLSLEEAKKAAAENRFTDFLDQLVAEFDRLGKEKQAKRISLLSHQVETQPALDSAK